MKLELEKTDGTKLEVEVREMPVLIWARAREPLGNRPPDEAGFLAIAANLPKDKILELKPESYDQLANAVMQENPYFFVSLERLRLVSGEKSPLDYLHKS